jgi:hypothetical protein
VKGECHKDSKHYCMVGELGVKGGIIGGYVRKLQKLCNFLK